MFLDVIQECLRKVIYDLGQERDKFDLVFMSGKEMKVEDFLKDRHQLSFSNQPLRQFRPNDRITIVSFVDQKGQWGRGKSTQKIISLKREVFIDTEYITHLSILTCDSPEIFAEMLLNDLRSELCHNVLLDDKAIGKTRAEFDDEMMMYQQLTLADIEAYQPVFQNWNTGTRYAIA